LKFTQKDKTIVRELAKRYMELATDENQRKMNARMRDTNDLKLVRPPVLIDEIPWQQMNIDDELTCLCEDEQAKAVELFLRKGIYQRKHFCADTLLEPFFRITQAFDSTGIGLSKTTDSKIMQENSDIVSNHYKDLLEDEENLELLKIPTFTARPDKDERAMELYTELLGTAMPVKLCGHGYFYDASWDSITDLRGLEPILYDLYDRPEYLHAIRQRFLDIRMATIDFIEQNLQIDLAPSLHCTPAYVSGLEQQNGWKGNWYRSMAQGFSDISPEFLDEFDIQYSIKIASRFAYTYYGCCEPLHNKLQVISKLPNLRKIGVSPWAKEEIMAEWMGGKYVYSRKPNPANVAVVTDPEVVRKETETTVKLCLKYGCPVDFTLKDISTVGNKPQNLIVWSKVVSDVLDEYYGK